MSQKSALPPELQEKNKKDYLEISKKIEGGLGWMEKHLDSLSLRDIGVSGLARRIGVHRNTISDPKGRGAYVIPRLKHLRNIKSQRIEASKLKAGVGGGVKREASELEKIQEQLEMQRKETAKQFLRVEYLKQKFSESESVLKKLAKENLLLQEENEALLRRSAANVTSIKRKVE